MSAAPAPLVTRAALRAFTQRLVRHVAPEQVILFGSQARGNARWDSDADLLVVMPFEGTTGAAVQAMLNTCKPEFPLDLHLRRPDEIRPRYRWGDPYIREARNPVVDEWVARAERHWRMATLLPESAPAQRQTARADPGLAARSSDAEHPHPGGPGLPRSRR